VDATVAGDAFAGTYAITGSASPAESGGPIAGTVTTSAGTTYANHGEYVAAHGGGSDAAHACIGMPIK
jgi:hypothetical protein